MAQVTLSMIQMKRGTAEALKTVNPVLKAGEPAYETDTYMMKFGDGVKAWNDLPYMKAEVDEITGVDGGEITVPSPDLP